MRCVLARTGLAFATVLLAFSGCASVPVVSAGGERVRTVQGSANEYDAFLADIDSILPGGLAGAAVAAIRDGVASVFLVGNPELTETTLFEFGSITKVITTNLLAQLALDGAIDLDQPVGPYLPSDAAEQWDRVTPRNLATHSAGVPGFPPNLKPVRMFFTGQLDDPFGSYGPAQLLEGVSRTPDGDVEKEWRYSNFGFGVLGYVLQQSAGVEYAQLAARRVLEPLGMTTATIEGWHSDDRAPALTRRGRPGDYWTFDAIAPAGALRGSILDGLAFLRASMGACAAADPASIANCLAQKPAGFSMSESSEMGLGWVRTTRNDRVVVWHNGGTGGFSSFLGFCPDRGSGVVILTNVGNLREIDQLALGLLTD